MAAVLQDTALLQATNNGRLIKGNKIDKKCLYKDEIRKQLRILDQSNAVNRYTWYNLPSGLTGQMIERILYYRGQGILFFMKENQTFYFLPYALCGPVDVYGRFTKVTPVQFGGSTTMSTDGKEKPWINGLEFTPVYDVKNELELEDLFKSCVILKDYTPQLSETNISRQVLQEPLLDMMSEAMPLARTSLIANSGIKGIRVQSDDDAESVKDASKTVEKAALNGNPWVPIQATMEFQDLTNGSALHSEEYLLYLQALDNYRLSLYGLDNGGLFQKKSHMLEAEQNMNAGHCKLTYQDGLTIRQRFCDIVNSIWGQGIWCEPSESVVAMDLNGDGIAVDELDQSGQPGDQPVQTETTEQGEGE